MFLDLCLNLTTKNPGNETVRHNFIKLVGFLYIDNTMSNCKIPLTKANCKRSRSKLSFRTFDGTCNNLLRPTMGATNTPFKRHLSIDVNFSVLKTSSF